MFLRGCCNDFLPAVQGAFVHTQNTVLENADLHV